MDRGENEDRGTVVPAPPAASATDGEPDWVCSALLDSRAQLAVRATATAGEAAWVRREFTAWLVLDVPGDLCDDIVLAVYEALANATEHAYADRVDGPIRFTARRSVDRLLVVVADEGRWSEPTPDKLRRRGLPLIRRLLRDVHVSSGDRGTVVHLGTGLPPPHGPFS